MGGMPHIFEKGRLCTLADSRYTRASVSQRIAWLNQLQAESGNLILDKDQTGALLTDLGSFRVELPDDRPLPKTHVQHLNEDWFGLEQLEDGMWQRKPGTRLDATGWWRGWTGDAHEIHRVAYVAALEASLGLEHRDRPAQYDEAEVQRYWPIEIFWTCPAPKYECCVTWFDHQPWWQPLRPLCRVVPRIFDGGGHVILVVSTPPANGNSPLSRFLDRGSLIDTEGDDYQAHRADDPLSTDHRRGLWIIGQNVEILPRAEGQQRGTVSERRYNGDVLDASAGHVSSLDDVVRVIRPSESDGGVLNDGRVHPGC